MPRIAAIVLVLIALGSRTSAAPAREEEIRFQSGSVTLSGTLFLPAQSGRRPAVVLVHGSGDSPRQPLVRFAERFAADGLVALIYDKRGSGRSEGSWVRASLDDLASDVLAATRFLKGRSEVDSSRIGAWAISQGGWVVPRAAAFEPGALSFVIVVTGGAIRPADVERNDYAARLDAAQVGPEEKRRGLALVDRYLDYLATGKDREGLERTLHNTAGEPAARALQLERVLPPPDGWSKWSWVPTYEPADDLRRLTMPALVILGGQDRPALAAQARTRWIDGLAAAGNKDATVLELVGAGHAATVAGTHHHGGAPPAFVPGYLEIVDAWAISHLAGSTRP
jgi:alpha-beta hydrolase superfamily lysophospholipase